MRIFYRRPLALAEFCFVLFTLASWRLPGSVRWVLFALFLIGTLGTFIVFRKKALTAALCLGLSAAALLSSGIFLDWRLASYRSRVGETVTASGVVLERTSSAAFESKLVVRLESFDGDRAFSKAVFETENATSLQPGDRFRAVAEVRNFSNDEGYDEERYTLSEGCLVVLHCSDAEDCVRFAGEGRTPEVLLHRVNTRVSDLLRRRVGGEEGALAAALLFGNRSFLTGNTSLNFRRAGVAHLLALSGLHVGVLVALIEWILKRLRLSKTVRYCVLPPLLLGYLFLTGASVSAIRAVTMTLVMILAFSAQESYDSFTSLMSSLVLILVILPYSVEDLSLWLSFLAAGAIIVFLPLLKKRVEEKHSGKPRRWMSLCRSAVSAIFIGVVTNCAVLLLDALVFGEFSLASIPATLLLSIPVTGVLFLSLLSFVIPPAAFLARLCAKAILSVAGFAASFRDVLLPMRHPVTIALAGLLTLALFCFAVLRIKHKRVWILLPCLFLSVVLSAVIFPSLPSSGGVRVTNGKSQYGDWLLFTDRSRATVVGDSLTTTTSACELAYEAGEAGCTAIDELIIVRYLNMQVRFVSALGERIRVFRLCLPEPLNDTERGIADRMEEVAARYGMEISYTVDTLSTGICVGIREHSPKQTAGKGTERVLLTLCGKEETLLYRNGSAGDARLIGLTEKAMPDADLIVFGSREEKNVPFYPSDACRLVLAPEKAGLGALPGVTVLESRDRNVFFLR